MAGIVLIKVIIQPNPFDRTIREEHEIAENLSFRAIYNRVSPVYPLEYAVIFDLDRKIAEDELDTFPQTDKIYIKVMPSGSNKNAGIGMKIGGAALIALGAVMMYTGFGAPLGVILIGTGIGLLTGGVVLYNLEIPKPALPFSASDSVAPSLRGGKNQMRAGGRVPVLLGKHLMVPDYCALPYVDINGNDQYLYQYFCVGYKDIILDAASYKIGDTPLTSEYFDAVIEETVIGSPNSFFPARKVQTGVSRELTATGVRISTMVPITNPPYFQEVITYTTDAGNEILISSPTNVKAMDIYLTFPTGLVYRNNEGAKSNLTAKVRYKIRQNYGDGTFGAWSAEVEQVFTDKVDVTKRVKFTIPLDNAAPGDPDYHARRQYDVFLYKVYEGGEDSFNYAKKISWDCISSETAQYDPTTHLELSTDPISAAVRDKLKLLAVKIKATDSANNVISQFNLVAQLKAPIWDGFGTGPTAWAVEAGTSNPAACMLYILRNALVQKTPVADDQIDWVSFENWYDYCYVAGLECNAVLSGELTTEDLLNSIISTGRASWSIVDGKYSINTDQLQPTVIQYFTPRNSWNFRASKVFAKTPTCLNVSFIDKTIGYVPSERKVYVVDGVEDDSRVQEVKTFGVTSAEEAYKHGKYMLACTLLRPETFTFDADFESIVCTRSDRIALNHDVIFAGLTAGRVTDLLGTTDIAGVVLDERVIFEPGKSYGVTIRKTSGATLTKTVYNPATTTNIETISVYFIVAELLGSLEGGELAMFGIAGSETEDFLIISIEPRDDLSCSITCVNYSPEIFDADTGVIPPYNPGISMPGDYASAVIMGITLDPVVESVNNTKKIAETDNTQTALTALNLVNAEITPTNGDIFDLSLNPDYNKLNFSIQYDYLGKAYGITGMANDDSFLYFIDTAPGSTTLRKMSFETKEMIDTGFACGSYMATDGKNIYIVDGTAGTISKYVFATGKMTVIFSGHAAKQMTNVYYYKNCLYVCCYNSGTTYYYYEKFELRTGANSTLIEINLSVYNPKFTPVAHVVVLDALYSVNSAGGCVKIMLAYASTSSFSVGYSGVVSIACDKTYMYISGYTGGVSTFARIKLGSAGTAYYSNGHYRYGTICAPFTPTGKLYAATYANPSGIYEVDATTLARSVDPISGDENSPAESHPGGKNFIEQLLTSNVSADSASLVTEETALLAAPRFGELWYVPREKGNTTPVACSSYLKDDNDIYYGINIAPVVRRTAAGYIVSQYEDYTNNAKTMTAGKLYLVPLTGLMPSTLDDLYFTEIPLPYATELINPFIFEYLEDDEIICGAIRAGVRQLAVYNIVTGAYIRTAYELDVEDVNEIWYIGFGIILYSDSAFDVYSLSVVGGETPKIFDQNIRKFVASKDQAVLVDNTGKVYYQARSRLTQINTNQPILKTTTNTLEVEAYITEGGFTLEEVVATDYSKVEIGDVVLGVGIQPGTIISNKRDGLLFISLAALETQYSILQIVSNKQVFSTDNIIAENSQYGVGKYVGTSNVISLKLPRGLLLVSARTYASDTGIKDSTKSAVFSVNNIDESNYTADMIVDSMSLGFSVVAGDLYAFTPVVAGSDPQISYIILQAGV